MIVLKMHFISKVHNLKAFFFNKIEKNDKSVKFQKGITAFKKFNVTLAFNSTCFSFPKLLSKSRKISIETL
jgi:hypothetical protein